VVVVAFALAVDAGCRSEGDDEDVSAGEIDCTADAGTPTMIACTDGCCTSENVPKEGEPCEGPFEGMRCNASGGCELPARGLCGNGWYEDYESCDNTSSQDCPSCNDGQPCTADSFTGSASTCNIVCFHTPIADCDPDEMAPVTGSP
jgi:hypothetical protein